MCTVECIAVFLLQINDFISLFHLFSSFLVVADCLTVQTHWPWRDSRSSFTSFNCSGLSTLSTMNDVFISIHINCCNLIIVIISTSIRLQLFMINLVKFYLNYEIMLKIGYDFVNVSMNANWKWLYYLDSFMMTTLKTSKKHAHRCS